MSWKVIEEPSHIRLVNKWQYTLADIDENGQQVNSIVGGGNTKEQAQHEADVIVNALNAQENKPEVMPDITLPENKEAKNFADSITHNGVCDTEDELNIFRNGVEFGWKACLSQQQYNGLPTDLKTLIEKLKSDYPEDDKMHITIKSWMNEAQQQIQSIKEIHSVIKGLRNIENADSFIPGLLDELNKIEQLLNK
jgi:hypothetical protein